MIRASLEKIVHRIFHSAMLQGRFVSAGCVYALVVFMFGFAFGAVRILLVVPRLGETVAALLELPFILLVS